MMIHISASGHHLFHVKMRTLKMSGDTKHK